MTEPMNCARDPRAGLQVTRFHSWPRVREQSAGEHSAQVMRILLTVWPNAPRNMLVHCLTHDIGEMAGDVQFPFKQRVPGLKKCMDVAEQTVRVEMTEQFGLPQDVPLNQFEHCIFKMCECIEMWEWGLQEQNLGNRYANTVTQRMSVEYSKWFEFAETLHSSFCGSGLWQEIAKSVKTYIERRLEWEK